MGQVEDFAAWYGKATYQERVNWLSSIGGTPQDFENVLNDEIKRQYGYLAAYLDHPEIGPLLRNAAGGGWTQERLQAELYRTQFWQKTSTAAREWDLLTRTDPAETGRRIDTLAAQLQTMVAQQGLSGQLSNDTVKWMAGVFLSQGLTEQEMQKQLLAQVHYEPGATPIGQAGMTMNQVKSRASDFGLPMSDESAFNWAKQVAMGQLNPDAVDVYLRDQAKSRYSWLAPDLDRGATIKQLFDPMIQQTSQLLEISPTQIDLTDPKYASMIDHVDSSGQRRSMTTAEAATYVRSTPEWQTTDNATKAASAAAESILRTFGKVSQ